jgi:hypothetical protein
MADYHIRHMGARPNYGEVTNRKIRVIMHFPVPGGNNEAGISWVDCIMADEFIDKNTILSDNEISPAEKTAIQNGEVIEQSVDVLVWEDATPLEKRDAVDSAYNTKKLEVTQELSRRYEFWGFARDIP